MDDIVRSICQNLVSNDQNVRRRGFKNVTELLKKNNTIDDLSLNKVCKGLYYCLWMTDDPIQIHKLSLDIIQLYKSFKSNARTGIGTQNNEDHSNEIDNRLRYIKSLMHTISKEWPLLDKNRVDKVLLFTRILVSEILYYVNDLRWDVSVLNKLSEVYMCVFNSDNLGLWLHFIQVYLNELVVNHRHLSDDNINGVDKNSVNNTINRPKNNDMTGVQLLYVLKPFVIMFLNTKDKLVLATIYNYVFKELHKLSDIADIKIVVFLLNNLLDSSTAHLEADSNNVNNDGVVNDIGHGNRLNGADHRHKVHGLKKKYIRSTLKMYEGSLKNDLTEDEKLHLEKMMCSIFPTPTSPEYNEVEDCAGSDHNTDPKDSYYMDVDYEDANEEYINLSNLSLRRMSKKRLRNLFILNNTKRYLILIKPTDDESVKFMNKLMTPKVKNQLFYYSLIRLKRLKLQYRFKHSQLDKIYNFNNQPKPKFNINLQQALDNIKNSRPLKSSLAKRNMSVDSGSLASIKKNKEKNVVFNLKINQVTSIPCRRKKVQTFSILNLM